MMKAAVQAKQEGICVPILLGNPDRHAPRPAPADRDLHPVPGGQGRVEGPRRGDPARRCALTFSFNVHITV